MSHIGKGIRKAHEITGILCKTVAQEIDCDPANYSHTLRQSGMTVVRFQKICASLGLTMDEVYKLGESNDSTD